MGVKAQIPEVSDQYLELYSLTWVSQPIVISLLDHRHDLFGSKLFKLLSIIKSSGNNSIQQVPLIVGCDFLNQGLD